MNTLPAGAGSEIQQEVYTMHFDFMNCYWNRRGAAQAKYDEMEAAGWEYNKTTEDTFHRYYRFYNDGEPGGSQIEPRVHRVLQAV